jgi:hypothetical protein
MGRKKNVFKVPPYLEQSILGGNGRPVGTIRLKPDSVGWKPRGTSTFYTVGLDQFADWIRDSETKAKKLK